MGALDRVFRSRRPSQERPLAAIIAGLWRNGEQGVWYDPSDLSTMFQDASGTLPVYAPGSGQVDPPVGLLLDKRLGLSKGPELLTNGEFASDSGWTKNAGWGISGGSAVRAPDAAASTLTQNIPLAAGVAYVVEYTISSITAGSITLRLSGGVTVAGNARTAAGTYKEVLVSAAGNTRLELYANAVANATIDIVSLRALPGNHAYQTTTTSRPTLSARYNQLTGTESLATQSVTVVATAYTLTTAGPGSVTLSGAASGTYTAGSRMVTCTAGALTLTVLGSVTQADLRPANDGAGLPPYQRVVDANTYDTNGFPLHIRFDGVDDFLQTASVDFSGTDKIFLASALRKLSDASSGIVAELTTNSSGFSGTFMLAAPSANGVNKFRFSSKGTVQADAATTASTYSAPYGAIVACSGNIGGAAASLRVNGAVAATSSAAQGTGNFTNAVLYIGRRGDATTAFNGRLYSMIICGAATPAATIVKVERYLNSKARIY